MIEQIKVVILAAGHGKRMQSEVPKALTPLRGKPLISHLLDSVKKSGICDRPVIVVGQKRELVMKTLGDEYEYVVQEEQLGTGHAVLATEATLANKFENIMVIYADMPFISAETIRRVCNAHISCDVNVTMGMVKLPDFNDWRKTFYTFGRIIKNANGKLVRIAYGKTLTPEESEITEVDMGYFCFKAEWLWSRLHLLKTENSHKEYYLTDLIGITVEEGKPPQMVEVPAEEAIGINSKDQLEIAEQIMARK